MSRVRVGARFAPAFLLASALALSGLFLVPAPAAACSVCLAGDPLFGAHGATAQEVGSFSLYLEARGFRKVSGLLPHGDEPAHGEGTHERGHAHDGSADARGGHEHADEEAHAGDGRERSHGQRLDLFASWTPLDRVTFTLDVPFSFNRIVEREAGERSRSTLNGLGDLSLASSFVLWRDRELLPSTWLEGRLWLKAPTGRDETEVDGRRDPHLQPGTGSWDFGGGLAAVHRRDWGLLYASVFYRENTPGSLDYAFGDVLLASAAVEVPLGHALGRPALEALTFGFGLDFRYAGHDHQDGARYEDSGGAILYATPALRVRLPWKVRGRAPSLRAAVQVPLAQGWLHGFQREKEVWSVGLLLPL